MEAKNFEDSGEKVIKGSQLKNAKKNLSKSLPFIMGEVENICRGENDVLKSLLMPIKHVTLEPQYSHV